MAINTITASGNFDTNEAYVAIDKYKPRPIPDEFL